jgi:PadR family transcriptional regulator, regulatory protein PadR
MNDEEKLKLEQELKKAAPLLQRLGEGNDPLPAHVRARLNAALDSKMPQVRELTERQMETLLLKLIAEQRIYGTDLVDAVLRARFRVGREGEGAILAILASLEDRELVAGEWRAGTSRMMKRYQLTPEGRQLLERKPQAAAELSSWVEAVVKATA